MQLAKTASIGSAAITTAEAESASEIDGLAAAVARANVGATVLANAAAWIAAAGARSVAELEPDDIDGALSSARPPLPLWMRGPGRACLCVCLRWSAASSTVRCGAELVAYPKSISKVPAEYP